MICIAELGTVRYMAGNAAWQPSHDDPLFMLAMDHRESFGLTLFGVAHDAPDEVQAAAMTRAKQLIFSGLRTALPMMISGRAGVLVDERFGQHVIDDAESMPVIIAVPVEASGHDWFTPEWGKQWLDHVEGIRPDYAKVLVRDNPDFDAADRERQLSALADVAAGLRDAAVPLLYELLVPPTQAQSSAADYDRDVRPELVTKVISDNQAHGIEPALWKVEGLETVEAAREVAAQARAGGHPGQLIVLGRDAPADRLSHWLRVAAAVPDFVGFAIGRSIWEGALRDFEESGRDEQAAREARTAIAAHYLGFIAQWAP